MWENLRCICLFMCSFDSPWSITYDELLLVIFYTIFLRKKHDNQRKNLFCVYLETVFLCFVCQCAPDFSANLNARRLGMVLKWSRSSALQRNRAGIFVFNLVVYKKIEFSKKLISIFFKNLFKKNSFFVFKKPALLSDSGRSSVHFETIPRFISWKLRKKSGAHGNLVFDP